jgi:translocation and assembly module TamB
MSRRLRRLILRLVAAGVVLLALVVVAAYFVLQSQWFYDKVRARLIAEVERATGGRAEIGAFHFDRANFSFTVNDFVLHGTEPAGKPPLFRAASVKVGLKLISLIKPNIDILSLDVAQPVVYLVIERDGRTNIPEPKVKRTGTRNAMETILDLAIDRVNLHAGVFEVEARSRIPIDFQGRNLAIQLAYDARGPRYKGTLEVAPMIVRYSDYAPQPFTTNLAITLERNRIAIDSGHLATSQTTIDLSGALEDLTAPHARFRYTARAAIPDIARIFRVPELRRGSGLVAGSGTWSPDAGILLTGNLHATGVEYRDSSILLSGFRADGAVEVAPRGIDVRGFRFSGFYVRGAKRAPLEGQVAAVEIRNRDLDLRGLVVTELGGTFRGRASVRNLQRYALEGEVAGIQASRAIDLFSTQTLPWDALVFGPVRVQGVFGHSENLSASGDFTLAPAPTGDPVRGQITASYDARTRLLDLGRSNVSLPHSRVEFSGAIGRELQVHLETRDLNDFLPAFGKKPSDVPVRLTGGAAVFGGRVTGDLNAPHITGHVRVTGFTYSAEAIDLFEGDVAAAPDAIRLQNGTIMRGALRARVEGSAGLSGWAITGASAITGRAGITNAPLTDALALAGANAIGATGTLNATANVTGTVDAPHVEGDVEVTRGQLEGEPFDRAAGHVTYSGHVVELRQAQIIAGPKQVQLSASYDHLPQRLDAGRLRFEVSTNPIPISSIRSLGAERPDVSGSVQATARGEVEIDAKARQPWRVLSLNADVAGKGLRLKEQPLGDAHLTAESSGQVLRAHLESTVAGSAVRGDGEWRLEGDYPGSATITFSRLDLANLRAWLTPEETSLVTASVDGQFHIQGPAANWRAAVAEIRIANFQIAPAPNTTLASAPLQLHNEGPMVARFANSVLTVESAHLVGRDSDLHLAGRVLTEPRLALDLRVEGRVDLALARDFVPDLVSSGTLTTSATIRGSFSDPQLLGRVDFQNAAFNIADVPNGISKASGSVTFTRERATIQSFTGETGGGKIELTGFAQYAGGQPVLFRLHARATEVRVRYPEGVSTVANANLNLSGTPESSTLSGNITIIRASVNLQSDFGSLLARSSEPVRTPSARPGLLGGMSFDVQVETAPETELQSSLTQGVQIEANLRLRGTVTNPAVLGRISITQGRLTFFGTQYTVSQGTVDFYNPVKVEPIVNIDLETKARGINIILSITGPLNKLQLTPRSDPPLQFNEIVALLAQGRAPTFDPYVSRQQLETPQNLQQAGATALLGSAIASPVAGRLQKFFGVSNLRIDPSLTGIENSPQARVTLEQQITPNVIVTYITNVTSSNPTVIRVEWDVSPRWSVVALREENGLLGVDIVYKRRFK